MISALLHSFDFTRKFLENSVAALSERQMVEQPPGVPNHATWTLSHVIFSCQGIAVELGTEPWLPDGWEATFGYGSTPTSELANYPNIAALLSLLTDAKTRLRQTLEDTYDSVWQQMVRVERIGQMALRHD